MCPTGAIHGANFPKPLDKDAVKSRIQERNRKAKEAAAAAAAAAAPAPAPAAPVAPANTEKKEDKA